MFCREGLDEILLELLNLPHLQARPLALGAAGRAHQEPERDGAHRHRRQVRRAARRLQEPERGAGATAASPTTSRSSCVYIDSEELEGGGWPRELLEVDGILVPIGFGPRGIEGKIRAIRYAREHKVPFFGICLGMQCMVIEYARNVVRPRGRELVRVRSRDHGRR